MFGSWKSFLFIIQHINDESDSMKAGQEAFMEYKTKIYVALLGESSRSSSDVLLLFQRLKNRQ